MIKTRFAPSPTGNLHIGGARTALFNYLYAKHTGGVFVLRIEDTDIERSKEEYTKDILEGLNWLGMYWDEGPHFQKERMDIYRQHAHRLLNEGKAYKCYCSTETLEEKRKAALREGRKPNYDRTCRDLTEDRKDQPFVIRFKSPVNGEVSFEDRIRGRITFKCEELDDLVILRTDNTPTYNFTVVVDDALMGITSIIRGDDHINNTPRQILIYEALNYETPEFAHVPLIHGKDKSRLSKRHGATSLLEYRNDGFLPEALMNYLARLGWAHGDQEVFSREDLIEKFDLGKVGKSPSIFDMDKLLWLNGHYLKTMPEGDIAARLEPFIENRGIKVTDKNKLIPVVINLRDRAKTLREMAEMAAFFFTDDFPYDENAKNKFLTVSTKPILERFLNEFTSVSSFDENEQRKLFETMAQDGGKKLVEVIQPVRVALCGRTVSPGIFEVVSILGRDSVVKRIKKAIASIA
ncbi:MAG TPA: glutamate--tRNA ligase [Syntrophorhabdus sp.]|jgi:glutamyl-tRNA synthetase|nr:glutamate--tRNA ligase [Syntrophorhabdus sp.]OQB78122.1 MAG: Glutamate--tRNA ligase [Deltaproteobacteria bacterium ADurb.Bin135]HOD78000.1 glutamate--tRNA ligase [Syntrophorhabdus sp.]HQH83230.1 glutamate--tRNA ligase [Syntrophorhabdus sp.]HQI96947.1 glutamate--tRNA ligase [Syntrophorhabdus sp.]